VQSNVNEIGEMRGLRRLNNTAAPTGTLLSDESRFPADKETLELPKLRCRG
jgi:hypothetical protein